MFSHIYHHSNNDDDLHSCTSSSDDEMTLSSLQQQAMSSSPRPMRILSPHCGLGARLQRRMRRLGGSKDSHHHHHTPNKFDSLAQQEQRQLAEEIKTCKHYVRTLQHSYKIRQHAKETSIMEVFAKEHATDLSEEIQLCEEELKYEESIHSVESSRRRGGFRDCSFRSSHSTRAA